MTKEKLLLLLRHPLAPHSIYMWVDEVGIRERGCDSGKAFTGDAVWQFLELIKSVKPFCQNQLSPTQHCRAIILQLKKKFFFKNWKESAFCGDRAWLLWFFIKMCNTPWQPPDPNWISCSRTLEVEMGGQVLGSLNIQPGGSHPNCGFWLPVWLYSLKKKKKILFSFFKNIYLLLAVLGLCSCVWASSSGLLVVTAPLAMEGSLQVNGLRTVAHRLSCSEACGIFLDQGSNPFPLHQQADS